MGGSWAALCGPMGGSRAAFGQLGGPPTESTAGGAPADSVVVMVVVVVVVVVGVCDTVCGRAR